MKRLRLGIVGCGAVTERYHLPAVAASDDVELVALVDPVEERASKLAREHGAPVVLTEHGGLPGTVDVAIVAAPNRLHAPIACDLARAGVHVLVEKPLARTAAECDEIAAAAREGKVVVAVGHDFRHFPVAQLARELLAGGLLGTVHGAELLQSAAGRWPYASAYVFSREESGGGVLIDFGVHMLDLLGWWLGDLSVRAYSDDTVAGVETECELALETASGAPVTVGLTRLRPMRDTTIVRCERGTIEIGIFEPAVIRLTLPDGGTLSGGVPDLAFDAAPLRTVFVRQLADFARAVRSGGLPLVSVAEGRRVVELVERCYAVRTPLRRAWDWPEVYAGIEGADDRA
jgi:predicted dehydrogenase